MCSVVRVAAGFEGEGREGVEGSREVVKDSRESREAGGGRGVPRTVAVAQGATEMR
jgi:hypothetical protein